MGVKTIPEIVSSAVKTKITGFIEHASQGGLEPLPEDESQNEQDIDMSDIEFQAKQADVPENSPGKKAVKDQDLVDARKRGLGKKVKK